MRSVIPNLILSSSLTDIMKKILLTLLAIVCAMTLSARDIYVATTGSDSNAGTLEAPYATIQKAFNVAAAGDNIIIRGGTYTTASHQYANQFMQNKSGIEGAPITIKAYEGETPILDGTNCPAYDPSMAVIMMWDVNYIVIDGLTIQNGTRSGMHFVGQCENITVKNCTVKDCTAPGIGFGGYTDIAKLCKNIVVTGNTVINCAQTSREAISLRWVENFEISHNTVKDVTKESIDAKSGCVNGRIFNNYIENAGHVGIYVDAGFRNTQVMHDIYVYDNIIKGVTGTGITVAAEEGNEGHSIYVYNNLVYNSGSASGAGIKVAMNSDNNDNGNLHDVYLCNNTVYNMNQQGFYVNLPYVQNIVFRNNLSIKCNANQFVIRDDVPASEVIFDHNMYLGNQYYSLDSSNLNGDKGYYSWEAALAAFFVDYANGDFRLAENSPAIDAGTDTNGGTVQGAPATDLDGKHRPLGNGYDIGCYEYGDDIVIPTTLTLFDDRDNTADLETCHGHTVDVSLKRTLICDGYYNTICLPFDLPGNMLGGATLKAFTGATLTGEHLQLTFSEVTDIEAGVPYLIKWDSGSDIVNPWLPSRTINKTPSTVTQAEGKVSFVGIFSPFALPLNNENYLFLGAADKLYYPTSGTSMKGFRAYFLLSGDAAGAKSFSLSIDGETTGIHTIDNGQTIGDGTWHTLDGQRLNGRPVQKGIYIHKGRKEVIL